MKPCAAALRGAREVGFTVLSMSLSLIAVFIPILLHGRHRGPAVPASSPSRCRWPSWSRWSVSLTTTPMMCARLLRPVDEHKASQGRFYRRRASARSTGCTDRYARSLDLALRHGTLVWVILLATMALNVWLYVIVPKGFFPQQDTGRLIGFIRADQATSFQAMRGKLDNFIKIVQADPAVDNVTGFTGGSQRNTGQMFVDAEAAERAQGVRRRDHRAAAPASWPGARRQPATCKPVQDIRIGGRQSSSQYQFTLQADDLETLRAWEPKVRSRRSRTSRAIEDVNTDTSRTRACRPR